MDYASDNEAGITNTYDLQYNWGPSDYDVRHTFASSWIYEIPWARTAVYGGWQLGGILTWRGGLPLTVTQIAGCALDRHRQPAEPGLRRLALGTRRSTSGSIRRASRRRTENTGTYGDTGRGTIRGPGSFNIDASLTKNTNIGHVQTEFKVEAFNVLNHPQFGNPNTTIGNAAAGTITAMLSSPSCSLCGTVERQVQLAFKVRF